VGDGWQVRRDMTRRRKSGTHRASTEDGNSSSCAIWGAAYLLEAGYGIGIIQSARVWFARTCSIAAVRACAARSIAC